MTIPKDGRSLAPRSAADDTRYWWRRRALNLSRQLDHIREDYDTVETELKQLLAERESCTCRQDQDAQC